MADLISREALMRDLVKRYKEFDDGKTVYHPLMTAAMQAVRNAPAVDAVEVVRCKDCDMCTVRRKKNGVPYFYKCDFNDIKTEPDDFCSHGERRADDAK